MVVAALGLVFASSCEHRPAEQPIEVSGYGLIGAVPRPCFSGDCHQCSIDALATKLAGPGAANCGWSRNDEMRPSLNQCALDAAAKGQPFLAIESLQGIDSFIIQAFVREPDGKLVQLWYDSDASGANCPCSAFVRKLACNSSLKNKSDEPDVLTCDSDWSVPAELLCDEKRAN